MIAEMNVHRPSTGCDIGCTLSVCRIPLSSLVFPTSGLSVVSCQFLSQGCIRPWGHELVKNQAEAHELSGWHSACSIPDTRGNAAAAAGDWGHPGSQRARLPAPAARRLGWENVDSQEYSLSEKSIVCCISKNLFSPHMQ